MITQIRGKSQVTIPKEVVKALNLKAGDHIDVGIEDGNIVIKPVLVIPRAQAWFWNDAWQQGERNAELDVERGRVTKEMDAAEATAHLDSLKKKRL